MTYPLVVVGAGGFGREVLDVVDALYEGSSRPDLLGVIDDGPSAVNLQLLRRRGVKYLGTVDEWLQPQHDTEHYVVGIGNTRDRQRIAEHLAQHGRIAATLVHPRAVLGTDSLIGAGTVVCAGALLSTNVRCGDHVHLNPGSIIGHDSYLRSYVSVNPGAVVSGAVDVREGATIGAGATVLQNLQVGMNAVVGAGACVTRDVPPHTTVMGVPAK